MGCGGSKLDDLEAVILCRERSRLLAEVIKYRYDLADAHFAYSKSLISVGDSLYRFLEGFRTMPAKSPVIQLPAQRKGEDVNVNVNSEYEHSSSGHIESSGHIDFKSDSSELDDEDDQIHLHSDSDSPIEHHLHLHHHHHHQGPGGPILNYAKSQPPNPSVSYFVGGGGPEASSSSAYDPYPILNCAKNQPPNPSVSYFVGGGEGEASSSSGYNPYPYYGYSYPTQNANFYPYSNYGYGDIGGGFFGRSSSPPVTMRENLVSPPPKETPPPPPPPSVSTWDFLNPFQNNESYYGNYTPSRSSKDVREEEGIPDLEDEENVVVKEAYGYDDKKKNKIGDSASSSTDSSKEDKVSEIGEEPAQPKNSVDASPSEENVVEKNVVVNEVKEPEAPLKRYNDIPEVVKEIKVQFDRASESAVELSKMLEVGKQPYHQRNSVYKVSSRMICGVNSLSSTEDEVLVFEDDKAMDSGNLSSTLQKLYIWEKKLYDEVKAEERMRVIHDKNRREMRRLDERGAEAYKLDSTLAVVRKLSTKIRIAIQVVDSISNKISKLRDDELWPQICELIQGLMRMWNVMLQCHRTQCRALSEVDSFASGGNISDAHMEITKQLQLELLEWLSSFSAWINAQKSYVWALNNWLLKGLRYVEEVTPDGIAPFSPGRLGAPPIFVICHQWAQTMERISEKEVIDAMGAFASNVLNLWGKHNFEQQQRLMANKDMNRTLRIMEREEQEMRRAVEAQNKKLILISGHNSSLVNVSENNEASNLQEDLRQIFEAMENFSASTLKAYEELHIRVEEQRLARENERVT